MHVLSSRACRPHGVLLGVRECRLCARVTEGVEDAGGKFTVYRALRASPWEEPRKRRRQCTQQCARVSYVCVTHSVTAHNP